MKLLKFAAAAMILLSQHVAADDKMIDTCRMIGDDAHKVMTNRQFGRSMNQEMKRVANIFKNAPEATELLQNIVLDAYREPRWNSDERQRQAARDFRNKHELKCFEALMAKQ